ncbi:hypothetical protein C265_15372 [Cupriavidus sp. GA3-3]|nr:hypothetical protein C265_15372 [Cupriavidus sp. GA3-3]
MLGASSFRGNQRPLPCRHARCSFSIGDGDRLCRLWREPGAVRDRPSPSWYGQDRGLFFSGPLFGVVISFLLWPEVPNFLFWLAAVLMALGVCLHLRERHEHDHTHEPMEHTHAHRHDEHHQHEHDFPWNGKEPHVHAHRHAPIVHKHPHYPDIHHKASALNRFVTTQVPILASVTDAGNRARSATFAGTKRLQRAQRLHGLLEQHDPVVQFLYDGLGLVHEGRTSGWIRQCGAVDQSMCHAVQAQQIVAQSGWLTATRADRIELVHHAQDRGRVERVPKRLQRLGVDPAVRGIGVRHGEACGRNGRARQRGCRESRLPAPVPGSAYSRRSARCCW